MKEAARSPNLLELLPRRLEPIGVADRSRARVRDSLDRDALRRRKEAGSYRALLGFPLEKVPGPPPVGGVVRRPVGEDESLEQRVRREAVRSVHPRARGLPGGIEAVER